LMGGQLWQPTADPTPFSCGLQSKSGPLSHHVPFESCEGTEHLEQQMTRQ
jgi:hypothetical protein